jgi:large subunit ribosomal protein L5
MAFLQEKYEKEVVPSLMETFGYDNPMTVPQVDKVIVNMGLGSSAVENPKVVESAVRELGQITGQRAVVTRARRAIAGFKLREGMPIGAKVTLRGVRMYEFLERLIYVALPRVRDFKGISPKSFDGHGNYTVGVTEQIIFPEINYDEIDSVRGMSITVVTSAENDDEARSLLSHMGMPFQKSGSRE